MVPLEVKIKKNHMQLEAYQDDWAYAIENNHAMLRKSELINFKKSKGDR